MLNNDIESIEQPQDGVRIITPRHVLRDKIGFGGLDPVVLARAEDFIKNNNVDYQPYAREFMEKLEAALEAAHASPDHDNSARNVIARSVMALKASGGMFQYKLVTEISDIVLNFIENLDSLTPPAMEILDVYKKIMTIVINGRMTDDSGQDARLLVTEISQACDRAAKKQSHPAR